MTDIQGRDSYSAADLDSAVDNFEDVEDAPLHPEDNFDSAAYLAQLVAQGRAENEAGGAN